MTRATKPLSRGTTAVPADAARPTCQVVIQYTPDGPLVVDEDITEMLDWFCVVLYEPAA